ncbi:MAG: DUF1295 domain-containing protein [Pararobbsia sp.]
MPIALTVLLGWVLLAIVLSAAWFRQVFTANANLVDPVESIALGLLGPFYAWLGNGDLSSRYALAATSMVWGLSRGIHLYLRNAGKPESPRYRILRTTWGESADGRLFWLFQLQAIGALVLSASFLVVAYRRDAPPDWALGAASVIGVISITSEMIANAQLRRFKADPANAGKTCRTGWWRYSRHPNGFFACTGWLMFVPLAWGNAWAWIALVSPVVMGAWLLKLSGVPLAEAQAAKSRADYADYRRRTSALIPWSPRRD